MESRPAPLSVAVSVMAGFQLGHTVSDLPVQVDDFRGVGSTNCCILASSSRRAGSEQFRFLIFQRGAIERQAILFLAQRFQAIARHQAVEAGQQKTDHQRGDDERSSR